MPISYNPIINNRNKKISELRGRDIITTYSSNSWIPIAQYNSRINSYHNLAINISSITSYCNAYSSTITSYEIDKLHDQFKDLEKLSYITNIGDLAYYINNSDIANAIVSYSFAYNTDYFEWQML